MSLIDQICHLIGDDKGILRSAIDAHQIEHLDFEPEGDEA